jgi:hypothetical protein
MCIVQSTGSKYHDIVKLKQKKTTLPNAHVSNDTRGLGCYCTVEAGSKRPLGGLCMCKCKCKCRSAARSPWQVPLLPRFAHFAFWLYLQSQYRLRNVALVCVVYAHHNHLTMVLALNNVPCVTSVAVEKIRATNNGHDHGHVRVYAWLGHIQCKMRHARP